MPEHDSVSTNNNPTKKQLKILIMDDDAQIRNLVSTVLKEEGHEIELAETSDEVLKKLGYSKYDLLILDVNMPGMNGYKLSEKLSKNIINRPKILIFTVRDILREQVQFMVSGADAIIQKGVSIDKLTETINNLFFIKTEKKTSPLPAPPDVIIKKEQSQENKNNEHDSTWRNFGASYKLESNIRECEKKILAVENFTEQRNRKYEQFIRDLLFEKQKTEKKFSEFKKLQTKLKTVQTWLYILFAISIFAILKSFL